MVLTDSAVTGEKIRFYFMCGSVTEAKQDKEKKYMNRNLY